MMQAVLVPIATAITAWPLIERWVESALEEGKADIAPGFVRACLGNGDMRLWLAWENRRAKGCCVTEFTDSVRGRYCNLVVVSGSDFALWRPLIADVKGWARRSGCKRLQAGGREGWPRLLKDDGWRRVRTVIDMEL